MSADKSRDSIMLAQIDDQSVLIGIEHQQAIDYSIPYRILMYDVIGYNQQFNLIDEYERKHFHPIPIITCVLYSGERRWNRPKSFSELITVPKCFKGKVNDWESYIYDIKDIDVEKLHHSDNRNLVDAVQKIYQWDKDIKNLPDMVMPKDVAIIVATITHQPELIERIEKEDKEEVNMCTTISEALLEQREKGEVEGRLEGRIATLITQLRRKLKTLSPEIEANITQSNDKQLELLTIHIFDIHTEEDILKIIS